MRRQAVSLGSSRPKTLVDRASTLGTVWLGLTVSHFAHVTIINTIRFRRCEFYSLLAFFNSVEEVGNGGESDARGNFKPVLRLPAPELDAQLAAMDAELQAARAKLSALDSKLARKQTRLGERCAHLSAGVGSADTR